MALKRTRGNAWGNDPRESPASSAARSLIALREARRRRPTRQRASLRALRHVSQPGVGDSQSRTADAILADMKSPRKKPTAAKLRNWRVAVMRSRAHGLGIVAAPDQKSAEAEAVKAFGLSEDQRKRLLIMERG